MTQRLSILLAFFLACLLAGCGGQAEAPRTSTAAASMGAQRGLVALGAPVTNEAARAAAARAAGSGLLEKQSALVPGGVPLEIDTSDREAVRLFFNRLYQEPAAPIAWTGNHATGAAGTTSAAFQAATLQRVNWYRAMAGLPAATLLHAGHSAKAQQAALMMSANGTLSHYPPASWKFYTAEGAEAAGSSNLALGNNGPDAIDAYIRDDGDNNYFVGHRRWILFPRSRTFGTGDVPAATVDGKQRWPANALWVTDAEYTGARPRTRDEAVAWPARGYAPYQVVFARWSLSYPDADFRQATVALTRNGAPVAVGIEQVTDGYAENTIVWKLPGIDPGSSHARPAADVHYRVTVANVVVNGQARSFSYDVTVFDPALQASGTPAATVAAPALVRFGQPLAAQVAPVQGATGYSLTTYRRTALAAGTLALDAATWTTSNGGSHAMLAPEGLRFYQTAADWKPQLATLNRRLFPAAEGGKLVFTRSIGYATSMQRLRVQLSDDDGMSWNDAFEEAGRDGARVPPGQLSIALDRYAGRMLRVRFVADTSGASYLGETSGWTIGSVRLEGVDELADEREQRSRDGAFVLSPAAPGSYVLNPRAELKGLYFTDPGRLALVLVDGALLRGPRAAYTLSRQAGTLVVVDNTGADGTQTIREPFRLDFSDLTLAFDLDGNAGQAYRLYRAAFDRQPDPGGLGFWIRSMDGGLSLHAMARGFAQSGEFATRYGAAPTHAQLVAALYRNVLHRAPDEAGAAYWLQLLANGMTVEQLLVEFSESAENKAQVARETELGIAFTRQ